MRPILPKRRQVSDADAEQTLEAITHWRDSEPATSREQIAVACGRSVSTIDRWFTGKSEPTVSDVRHMEAFKSGLVLVLFAELPAPRRPKKLPSNGRALRA